MIKILGIETSTQVCSVALLSPNGLFFRIAQEPRAHTRLLLPMIDSVLKESGESLKNMDVLAYGAGPGSFTGVRIASSTTQALAYGLNKPVVSVSSLRVLAQGVYRKKAMEKVLALIDARMNEIYSGLFLKDDKGIMQLQGLEQLSPNSSVLSPDRLNQDLLNMNIVSSCLENDFPEAQDLVLIAAADYVLGLSIEAEEVVPVYLREKVT